MEATKTPNRTLFDKFKTLKTNTKVEGDCTFLETHSGHKRSEQLQILTELSKCLPLFSCRSFEDLVHFQHVKKNPVQRWFPYREGYSIQLVDTFIKDLKITGNIFDPFVGTGTTLLASRMNNLNSFGIDVNPVSVFIAKVENEQYNSQDIIRLEKEKEEFAKVEKSKEVFSTSFRLADKVFNEEILQALLQFKQYISYISHKKVKNIFFLAWLAIIERVSNIKKEGNGIKYKNRKRTRNGYITIEKMKWEEENLPTDKYNFVKVQIINLLSDILLDLKVNYGSCNNKPSIYQGSCLRFDDFFKDEFELTFKEIIKA